MSCKEHDWPAKLTAAQLLTLTGGFVRFEATVLLEVVMELQRIAPLSKQQVIAYYRLLHQALTSAGLELLQHETRGFFQINGHLLSISDSTEWLIALTWKSSLLGALFSVVLTGNDSATVSYQLDGRPTPVDQWQTHLTERIDGAGLSQRVEEVRTAIEVLAMPGRPQAWARYTSEADRAGLPLTST